MKQTITLIFMLALLLAACQGGTPTDGGAANAQEEIQATATQNLDTQNLDTQPQPEEMIADTATPEAAGENEAPIVEANLGEPMPGCQVVSFNPTPEPTLQAIFAPPGEGDWVKGPDTASVTITEYSDFQ